MKHTKTIIGLGVLVALVPFLGFPSAWKNVIFAFLGLSIVALAFRLLISTRSSQPNTKEKKENTSAETGHVAEVTVAHE
ncbi:MAG: hypothetical protein JKX80_02130 [Candidatus Pacebacteria bacterium]|nr:hypothetical protein [Candidatus Paceibacterota bacterium]